MSTSCDEQIRTVLAAGVLEVLPEAGVILRRGKPARTRPSSSGHYQVSIGAGRLGYVHRVVWIAAHGSIPDGMTIDHLNGDKADNRLSNLEPVSVALNIRRNRRLNHYDHQVRDAFEAAGGETDDRYTEVMALMEKGATRRDVAELLASWRESASVKPDAVELSP